MSRLTKKFNDNSGYEVEEYGSKYSEVKLDAYFDAVDKLGKLEDLEEEIGCPLEVRCRIVTDSVIYDENGVDYKVVYIYKEHFDCENPFDNEMGYCDLCAFSWADYKETWWLKRDKSE